jgi:hypothetical protein
MIRGRAWLGMSLLGLLAGCAPPPPAVEVKKEDPVARGKYLVTIMGCNDCHTPLKMGPKGPAPDMTRMLSGHPEAFVLPAPPALAPDAPWNWSGAPTLTAFAGPWGISYAINLTPDKNTGLGPWTEEMFVKAMRTGTHWGSSRPILPPMPWQNMAALGDEDMHAVWAFLQSIPAIANRVPDSVVAGQIVPAH